MSDYLDRPVVVGFDGTDRSRAALRYGIAEANRRRTSLRVVHVSPSLEQTYVDVPGLEAEVRAAARRASDDAAAEVARSSVAVPLTVCETTGSVAEQILGKSDDAQLVVLGRETKSPVDRLVTGSTSGAVARRSAAPVVVVPQEWTGDRRPRGHVVVGLRNAGHTDGLLEAGFAEAAASHAELHVLHAWKVPDPYVDRIEGRTHADDWDQAARDMVNTALDEWHLAYPSVRVAIDVVHQDAAEALVRASESASLLLLSRRELPVLGPHLGHVGRAVLHAAHCPVEVVPAKDALGLVAVESAGAILR